MPKPEYEPEKYLSKRGRTIFFSIIKHVKEKGILEDIDTLELSMLCNSFVNYEKMAQFCSDNEYTEEVTGKNGTFKMVRPEYSIMRNEYANVLKHSGKFGINPADRLKAFGKLKKTVKKDPGADLD